MSSQSFSSVASKGLVIALTPVLTIGMRPRRCAMNSSLSTVVLSLISTRSIATVGTCTNTLPLVQNLLSPSSQLAQAGSNQSKATECKLAMNEEGQQNIVPRQNAIAAKAASRVQGLQALSSRPPNLTSTELLIQSALCSSATRNSGPEVTVWGTAHLSNDDTTKCIGH